MAAWRSLLGLLSWCLIFESSHCNSKEVQASSTVPHYSDVIMGAMASQITSLTFVYQTVYSGVDQRKHHSSASLAFVRGIHRWPVNSPHKRPVTRKMFPFDDVIMRSSKWLADLSTWEGARIVNPALAVGRCLITLFIRPYAFIQQNSLSYQGRLRFLHHLGIHCINKRTVAIYGCPSEIFKLKSREISFAHISFLSCPFDSKCCPEHDKDNAALWEK